MEQLKADLLLRMKTAEDRAAAMHEEQAAATHHHMAVTAAASSSQPQPCAGSSGQPQPVAGGSSQAAPMASSDTAPPMPADSAPVASDSAPMAVVSAPIGVDSAPQPSDTAVPRPTPPQEVVPMPPQEVVPTPQQALMPTPEQDDEPDWGDSPVALPQEEQTPTLPQGMPPLGQADGAWASSGAAASGTAPPDVSATPGTAPPDASATQEDQDDKEKEEDRQHKNAGMRRQGLSAFGIPVSRQGDLYKTWSQRAPPTQMLGLVLAIRRDACDWWHPGQAPSSDAGSIRRPGVVLRPSEMWWAYKQVMKEWAWTDQGQKAWEVCGWHAEPKRKHWACFESYLFEALGGKTWVKVLLAAGEIHSAHVQAANEWVRAKVWEGEQREADTEARPITAQYASNMRLGPEHSRASKIARYDKSVTPAQQVSGAGTRRLGPMTDYWGGDTTILHKMMCAYCQL